MTDDAFVKAVEDAEVAKLFHDTYEQLAPDYGYKTRGETAVAWEDVPWPNKTLMIDVAGVVREHILKVARPVIEAEYEKARGDIADLLNEEEARRAAMRTERCGDRVRLDAASARCDLKLGHHGPHANGFWHIGWTDHSPYRSEDTA